MAKISENPQFGTTVEAIAPRIVMDWNPYTDDGPVTFHFERLTRQSDGTVVERTFLGVLPAKISELMKREYTVTNPETGNQVQEPGWKLMALVKAATDAVFEQSQAPAMPPAPAA